MIDCEDCKDIGYIETYNTMLNIDTIEKCDSCNTINNDKDATIKYLKTLLRGKRWEQFRADMRRAYLFLI